MKKGQKAAPIIAQIPLAQLAVVTEYRCVIEICAPTPGYKGFSMKAVAVLIQTMKEDAATRRAFRFARGRKLVFGFTSLGALNEFLWEMRDLLMTQNDHFERAFYSYPQDLL